MATRESHQEAAREDAARRLWRQWVGRRVEAIHEQITIYDVFRHIGLDLPDDTEVQFSCPFHGLDRKPSARVYPAEGDSRSHAWCFVCQERWDAISVWQRAHHGDVKAEFVRSLGEIERAFNLTVPEMPSEATYHAKAVDEDLETFRHAYITCETILREARPTYRQLGDMKGFLSACQVLDKLLYRVTKKTLTAARGVEVLRQLMERIAEKERRRPVEWATGEGREDAT